MSHFFNKFSVFVYNYIQEREGMVMHTSKSWNGKGGNKYSDLFNL